MTVPTASTPLFFLPESDDRVDPDYNFEVDCYGVARVSGIDHDVYAHEILSSRACDGLLVTRSGVGFNKAKLIKEAGGIHRFLQIPSNYPIDNNHLCSA
jgi:hypothetical protein